MLFFEDKTSGNVCLLAAYLITAHVLTLALWLGVGLREGLNCHAIQ